MKNRVIWMVILVNLVLGLGYSSTPAQSTGGVNRVEFFGGFSHNRVVSPFADEDLEFLDFEFETGTAFQDAFGGTKGSNGANFSITGNFSKWVGAKFDVSTHSSKRSGSFEGFTIDQKHRLTNYLGGIQVKNNAKDGPRVKPFFHVLAGVANQKVTLSGNAIPIVFGENSVEQSETNFALGIGGGLDIKVHKNVDIRVFQVDFNPTYIKETDDFSGKYQGNVRFGFGIVIH